MKIRQVQIKDIEPIYQIEIENFDLEAIPKSSLIDHIEKIKTSFLVAESDDKILGYIEGPVTPNSYLSDESFTNVRDYSHARGGYISITSLSISKAVQSRGLGKLLIEAMKKVARSDNRQGINLTCHDYLITYYEKNGFVNHGLSQSKYSGGVWYDMVWENPDFQDENIKLN